MEYIIFMASINIRIKKDLDKLVLISFILGFSYYFISFILFSLVGLGSDSILSPLKLDGVDIVNDVKISILYTFHLIAVLIAVLLNGLGVSNHKVWFRFSSVLVYIISGILTPSKIIFLLPEIILSSIGFIRGLRKRN